jgi:hypothetical protein
METKKIWTSLAIFGKCNFMRLNQYVKQSGLSEEEINDLVNLGYCKYGKDSDGDKTLCITNLGKSYLKKN